MPEAEAKSYADLLDASPVVRQIITPDMAQAMFGCNTSTIGNLEAKWKANTRKNIELYKEHGSLADAFAGFGRNKAIIAVGAGPSFNLNKNVLKQIYEFNVQFPLADQPFIIVASNKQYKPLLDMGIYPHFVLLIDAGDALYDQICHDVSDGGKSGILITGLHTSPKINADWSRRGGGICYFMIGDESEKEWFAKETGHDPERVHIQQGGNVTNTLWVLANRIFQSSVFIMVGCDNAFKYSADKQDRQNSFYADADYRFNILNQRDEAKDYLAWMGFRLREVAVQPGKYMYDLNVVGVSRQLWVYKTWLEVQAAVWADKHKFFIYNASEAGALGVLARDYSKAALMDKDNWFLIDELLPKRWLTTSLDTAAGMYLEARRRLWQATPMGILDGANDASNWLVKTATASIIAP